MAAPEMQIYQNLWGILIRKTSILCNNKTSITTKQAAQYRSLPSLFMTPILLFCGQFPNCSNVEMPKTLLPSVGCNAENLDKKI